MAPLFLWVSWTAPHRPMEAVAEDEAVYPQTLHPRLRTYGAMVTALDSGVQMVVGALRRRAMLLDSLVLFLSDNGATLDDLVLTDRFRQEVLYARSATVTFTVN